MEFKSNMPGEMPTVDFDYFYDQGNTWDTAQKLAIILMDAVDIDQLHFDDAPEQKFWPSSIGTGGGSSYDCPTQGTQQAALASHFASYSKHRHTSCLLTLREYNCIKELKDYYENDYWPADHRRNIVDEDIKVLQNFCKEFEQQYVKIDPSFLFRILKETKELV